MTSVRPLERELPRILDELATAPYPEYIEDVLALTAQRHQRPAWTAPERWWPVESAARRVHRPASPLRALAIALLAILLGTAALALYIGSSPRLPEPFGLAANGRIVFVDAGRIYASDGVGGTPRLLVGDSQDGGTQTDVQVSRDGRWISFLRGTDDGVHLFVADIDGASARPITPEPLWRVSRYSWSPDGSSIVVAHEHRGFPVISILRLDGSAPIRVAAEGLAASEPDWRPPDGRSLAFRGQDATNDVGIYLVGADGTGVQRIDVRPAAGSYPSDGLLGLTWSPDGSRLAYHANDPVEGASDGDRWQVHVVDVESGADINLSARTDLRTEDTEPQWSPDGRSVLVQRFRFGLAAWMAVIPADGSTPGVDLDVRSVEYPPSGWRGEFSPDGTLVIAYYDHTDEALVFDPTTGEATELPWSISEVPTFQRLAP